MDNYSPENVRSNYIKAVKKYITETTFIKLKDLIYMNDIRYLLRDLDVNVTKNPFEQNLIEQGICLECVLSLIEEIIDSPTESKYQAINSGKCISNYITFDNVNRIYTNSVISERMKHVIENKINKTSADENNGDRIENIKDVAYIIFMLIEEGFKSIGIDHEEYNFVKIAVPDHKSFIKIKNIVKKTKNVNFVWDDCGNSDVSDED